MKVIKYTRWRCYTLFFAAVFFLNPAFAQNKLSLLRYTPLSAVISKATAPDTLGPLDQLLILNAKGKTIIVTDGLGKIYFRANVKPTVIFTVGGALGKQTISVVDDKGKVISSASFYEDAKTSIDDGGYYADMFRLFYNSMWDKPGQIGSITWNGKLYHYFVNWGLDDNNTMKGLKYFNGQGTEFIDLCREAQRSDGMIWSFVQDSASSAYWLTRDKYTGYSKIIGDKAFIRQPTENHPEYIFVNAIYQCWKAAGDMEWMKKNLTAASKALDYSMNDPARWSKRFGLLKRVYTIDSWDFAVDDEYLPGLGLTNTMIIDPVRSKFGVFFGDNTGYITACAELSEMLIKAGLYDQAEIYSERGAEMKERLDKLAWNGHFFTHFIDEDSTVKRHLGVDEKTQIAQSNAYSLNRDIAPEQKKAIIETYLNLKDNLPVGSPGEWYAIYPPFQQGFGLHNSVWQYMNGGVGGHVAGELARGAFENGYENYGADILNRLFELGKKYDHKIYFAYTGSIPPPPPPPVYKPLDIKSFANMDFEDKGSNEAKPWMLVSGKGDDLHELPVGDRTFSNIRFNVINPDSNNRKAVFAASRQNGLPSSVEIPVNDTTACIYLLHTATKPGSENVSAYITFVYADGTRVNQYLVMGKQLSYWWFPQLKTDYSGIAWHGKNSVSEGVGLSWCAIDNPESHKLISKIIINAPIDGIYTLFGITLADKPHYVPANPVSYGGPDNWAGATAMAAMVEGLAGIKDAPGTEAFSTPVIAPRWINTNSRDVSATVRYAASKGYVSYRYQYEPSRREIRLFSTGGGQKLKYHIELPAGSHGANLVTVACSPVKFSISRVDETYYADFERSDNGPAEIIVKY